MAKKINPLEKSKGYLRAAGLSKGYLDSLSPQAIYTAAACLDAYANGRSIGNPGYRITKAEAKAIVGQDLTTNEKKEIDALTKSCRQAGDEAEAEVAKEERQKKKEGKPKEHKVKAKEEKPAETKSDADEPFYKRVFTWKYWTEDVDAKPKE